MKMELYNYPSSKNIHYSFDGFKNGISIGTGSKFTVRHDFGNYQKLTKLTQEQTKWIYEKAKNNSKFVSSINKCDNKEEIVKIIRSGCPDATVNCDRDCVPSRQRLCNDFNNIISSKTTNKLSDKKDVQLYVDEDDEYYYGYCGSDEIYSLGVPDKNIEFDEEVDCDKEELEKDWDLQLVTLTSNEALKVKGFLKSRYESTKNFKNMIDDCGNKSDWGPFLSLFWSPNRSEKETTFSTRNARRDLDAYHLRQSESRAQRGIETFYIPGYIDLRLTEDIGVAGQSIILDSLDCLVDKDDELCTINTEHKESHFRIDEDLVEIKTKPIKR